MSSLLAHPLLFDAAALDALPRDGREDPDLRPGVHLRLLPSGALGLPLAPFRVAKVEPDRWRAPVLRWAAPDGRPAPAGDLDAVGGELMLRLGPPPGGARVLGVEFRPQDGTRIDELALLGPPEVAGGPGRLLALRREPPFLVGGSLLWRVRIRGRGRLPEPLVWITPKAASLSAPMRERVTHSLLSLPLDAPTGWYAAPTGSGEGIRRVLEDRARRFGPPDMPDPPFADLLEVAERARLDAAAPEVMRWLLKGLAERPHGGTREGEVALRPVEAVLLQALDPMIARFLGLMARLEDRPSPDFLPPLWAACGVFAVEPRELEPLGLASALPQQDADEAQLLDTIKASTRGLDAIMQALAGQGLTIRALVAPALAVPPREPPATPPLRLGAGSWVPMAAGAGESFRREVLIPDMPLATLVAVAREEGGAWVPSHRPLAAAASAWPGPDRHACRLPGEMPEGRRLAEPASTRILVESGLVPLPAPQTHRVWLGDLFGRYGAPAPIDLEAPPRPPPPAPVPQLRLVPADPPPGGPGPKPFGRLRIVVPVPKAEQLAAGARPVTRLAWRLGGGAAPTVENLAGAEWSATVPLGVDLEPAGVAEIAVSFAFLDADGASSDTVERVLRLADPRPPPAVEAGPGLVWTGRPGADPEVELKLAWAASAGQRVTAWIADAAALAPAAAARTRARIAQDAAARPLDAAARALFRPLLPDPVTADAAGRVLLDARLPRSLTGPQLVCLVPLGAQGVAAAFDAGARVTVAVPPAEGPPSPRLSLLEVDAASGAARLEIVATGLDWARLRLAEPGLFGDPGPGVPPQWRLRRAGGRDADPAYARVVQEGGLTLDLSDPERPRAVAEVTDPGAGGLLPFVRYTYWAEVRPPPERRLPHGVAEVAGAVRPPEEWQVKDLPARFGLPSLPVAAMHVPEAPPDLAAARFEARLAPAPGDPAKVVLAVTVANGPVLHPRAIGPYRLRLWLPTGEGGELQRATPADLDLAEGAFDWTGPAFAVPADGGLDVQAALVDPVGRVGPVLASRAV